MPIYAYKCPECENEFDKILKLVNYQDPQGCPECDHAPCPRKVTKVNFNLKGDGWVSKNGRIAGQMRRKNKRLGERSEAMKRDQPLVSLVPNVNGVETGTWKEAQKFAASVGKDPKTYEKKVRQEKKGIKN